MTTHSRNETACGARWRVTRAAVIAAAGFFGLAIGAAAVEAAPPDPATGHCLPRQRVTVAEAIKKATWNSAFQLRLEDRIGSIEVGKQADLVVLGADLFQVPPERIHAVPVVLTLMDGRPTHDARSR